MLSEATAYGLKFRFPAGDTTVGPCLRDYGEFARVITAFLIDHADGGALVDVGANIGSICLPFARRLPSSRVLAIEAHGGLAQILAGNAGANGLSNVEVLHAAAGEMAGEAEFPAYDLATPRNFGNIGFGMDAPVMEPVKVVTLDDVAPANTRLVKIDVEGFEPQVLRGASRLLAERPVWLIEAAVQHPEASRETIRIMLEAGYQVFWFYAPFVTPASAGGPYPEPSQGDSNIVALPPGAENRWNLRAVSSGDETRPRSQDAYPYLARYGFVPKVRTSG